MDVELMKLTRVSTRLTDEQLAALNAIAKAHGLSTSDALRGALQLWVLHSGGEWPEAEIKHGDVSRLGRSKKESS